jgi:hypothetical protein
MKPKRTRLTDGQKTFVVRELACFGSPKEVSEALMAEYSVHLAPQNVEAYDPTKRAGEHLSTKWRELFERCRMTFLENVEGSVPEAHKAVRIRQLAFASRAYKAQRNYVGMADMLERIAKEVGNVHTNRRELSGPKGKPIQTQELPAPDTMSPEEILAELRSIFGIAELSSAGGIAH